jgi:hypothetical protein
MLRDKLCAPDGAAYLSERNAIMAALSSGVPARLESVSEPRLREVELNALAQQLASDFSMERAKARWAVGALAWALHGDAVPAAGPAPATAKAPGAGRPATVPVTPTPAIIPVVDTPATVPVVGTPATLPVGGTPATIPVGGTPATVPAGSAAPGGARPLPTWRIGAAVLAFAVLVALGQVWGGWEVRAEQCAALYQGSPTCWAMPGSLWIKTLACLAIGYFGVRYLWARGAARGTV